MIGPEMCSATLLDDDLDSVCHCTLISGHPGQHFDAASLAEWSGVAAGSAYRLRWSEADR